MRQPELVKVALKDKKETKPNENFSDVSSADEKNVRV
jgi:hypothetical protein